MTNPITQDRSTEHVPTIQRVRHPLQVRVLSVLSSTWLTPSMRRLTLAGESLHDLHSDGFDDHVKLLLPPEGQTELVLPPPGPDGRPDFAAAGLPSPIARDYTPRRVDRQARTLDIDFCLHGEGPAASWAARAEVGDVVHVAGPRGSMVVPAALQWQWLIGDESAMPAIARRLEELGDEVVVTVVLEVPTDDAPLPPLRLGPRTQVIRVVRPQVGEASVPLVEAVRALPAPVGLGHAFAAAESSTAKAVREVLVGHHGLHKGQVRASAYWRRGASAHHENLEG